MVRTPKLGTGKLPTDETHTAIQALKEQFDFGHGLPGRTAEAASTATPTAAAKYPSRPEYKLIHRGEFDMSDFMQTHDAFALNTGRPKVWHTA